MASTPPNVNDNPSCVPIAEDRNISYGVKQHLLTPPNCRNAAPGYTSSVDPNRDMAEAAARYRTSVGASEAKRDAQRSIDMQGAPGVKFRPAPKRK